MKPPILFALAVLFSVGNARILNVPAQYSTIQSAIVASVDGDTIVVAPGTYNENIIFRGKNVVVTSNFYLNADPSIISNTIINGGTPAFADSGSCARFTNGEDTTAVLQGFTLTGGYGTLWQDEHGPGRYWEGGGILVAFSNPTIKHNIIRNNNVNRTGGTSTGGGGIRVGDSSPRILNNIIVNNAGMYGGGIVSNYASPVIRNNIIAYNVVSQAIAGLPTYGGGGVWHNGNVQGIKVENNTIVGNSATGSGGSGAGGKGGGILAVFGASMVVRNNIVWGNTQSSGGPINITPGSSVLVHYSCVEGGGNGIGNIDLAPQFSDTSFYLLPGSPCIDAGDTSSGYNDPPNTSNPSLAQWPSMGGLRNDIGAYGGPFRNVIGTMITSVHHHSHDEALAGFILEQNYPNPFNPSTTISFSTSSSQHLSLKVYNLLGEEVRTLSNETLERGRHEFRFDAAGLPTGVYFYRLSVDGYSETKRAVLLR